ncbi:MAG: thiol-activated cytolysin family protein [Clostridium sp.]|uniref:thiol-activated cytolysin family protein n=1 Tax=Clostridium sp. TaxID=1506 RepID=UPI002FC9DC31
MQKIKSLNSKRTSKGIILYIIIILCIIMQPIEVAHGATITNSNAQIIDNGIYNLNYNPKEVLAANGESVESFVKAQGKESSGKFIVVNREKKSISTSTVDISLIDSVNDRIYPGAIQRANKALVDNRPDLIVCKRKPLTISVDLPGMGYESKKVVKNPTHSNVVSAIDTLVSKWTSMYEGKYTLPARTQYSESMVYSESQLSTALKVNSKAVSNSLGIDFSAVAEGNKTIMVAAYKQIFYTVSCDLPESPSQIFGEDVTFKELERKGINNENPPTLVSNVSYGRTIYVKLESTSKSKNVKSAFKALLQNTNVEANAEYKDILNQSSFTAVVLGGDSKEHNKIITNDFGEIRDVIKSNAEFSAKNPGYPISYTSVFLKDNSIASIKNKTDYVETTATEYNDGKIILDHRGAYVARFYVSWDEVSYDDKGNEILTHKTWSGNDYDRTAHFNTEIPLDGNARNISVKIKECTGLAWEWWRTIVDVKNIPLVKERIFYISGTTLYPYKNITTEV